MTADILFALLPLPIHLTTAGGTTMRKPMLDPKRDLAGATPETLARALLRRTEPLRPRPGGEPVVGDEAPVRESAAHEPEDGAGHLVEGV